MDLYAKTVETSERKCLNFLAKGGSFVAADIQAASRDNFTWQGLLNLERSGLVCRASDYENPRSYHHWKISGCGLLALAAASQS